jgi:hypothetical protein
MRARFSPLLASFVTLLAACGGKAVDAGGAGGTDAGQQGDAAPGDGGATDAGGDGALPPGACRSDADCAFGAAWCVHGVCEPCDDAGQVCDLGCRAGWQPYTRNGCTPCACAPPNDCTQDADCASGKACYAGAFCWEGCAPGDPRCCFGNVCTEPGCAGAPPIGCFRRGCPEGQYCEMYGCASSACRCSGGSWECLDDCGGGVCVTPL